LHEEQYRYDATSRRIEVLSDNDATVTIYDSRSFVANEWARFNSTGDVVQRFLLASIVDQHVAESKQSGSTKWVLTDRLGSIRDMVNNDGQIIQHIEYTVFGNPTFYPPTGNAHALAFTGRDWGSVTALSFHRARFYDVHLGRFVSIDPLGFEAGDVNLFRYVGNLPVNGMDPSGRNGVMEFIVLTTSLSAIAGAIAGANEVTNCSGIPSDWQWMVGAMAGGLTGALIGEFAGIVLVLSLGGLVAIPAFAEWLGIPVGILFWDWLQDQFENDACSTLTSLYSFMKSQGVVE